jgi:hypothetical protein
MSKRDKLICVGSLWLAILSALAIAALWTAVPSCAFLAVPAFSLTVGWAILVGFFAHKIP